MRTRSLLPSALFVAASAVAQGVVNPSLLRAPEGQAASTWSTAAFEQVQASVVYVAVQVDGARGEFVIERASSGVVASAAGHVVTFDRLVAEAIGAADKRVVVRLNDASNTELVAEVLRRDDASGLALLKVAPPADGLQPARLAEVMPRFGEPSLVVARPQG